MVAKGSTLVKVAWASSGVRDVWLTAASIVRVKLTYLTPGVIESPSIG
jgi:hypothetical protein